MPLVEYIVEEAVSEDEASKSLAAARQAKRKADEAQALRTLAKAQLAAGSHFEALQTVTTGLALFRELANKSGEGNALLLAASIQQARGLTEESLFAAKEALKIFKDTKDRKLESAALYTMAEVKIMAQDYKEALQVAQDALDIAKSLGYKRGEVLLLSSLAAARLGAGLIEEALLVAKQALDACPGMGAQEAGPCEDKAVDVLISVHAAKKSLEEAMDAVKAVRDRHTSSGNKSLEAATLVKLAKIHGMQDELSSAIMVAKQAVAIAQESGDKRVEAAARSQLGRALLASEELEEAQKLGMEAATLFRELPDRAAEVTALEVVINASVAKGDPEEGIRVATEALDRFSAAGDRRMQATVMLAIADVNLGMQDIEGALVFFKKARATFNEIKDSRGEGNAYHKIAQLATTIGDIEEALWSTQRATALFRKMKDKSAEAGILLVTADMCFAKSWGFVVQGMGAKSKQETKEAQRNAELALGLFKAASNKPGQALALLSVGNAQLMLKDAEAALKSASDSLVICEELGLDHTRAGALLLQGGAHLMEGRVDSATQSGSEARQAFRQRSDALGDEAAANFMKDAKDVESGTLEKENFPGFYLRGTDSFQPMPAELAAKTKREERQRQADRGRGRAPPVPTSNILIMSPNSGDPSSFFIGFESRQAGVSQTTRIRKVEAEDEAKAEDMSIAGPRYRAEVPPVYAVRWQGIDAQPQKPGAEGKTSVAEGPFRGTGFIDAGPVGAGTTFPPMFRVSVQG